MNLIINIFQDNAFLQTEWFWSFLTFLLTLSSAVVAIVIWRMDSKKKLNEERQQSIALLVRSDLEMKDAYRNSWSKIAAFEGDAEKQIFRKKISDISDDNIRVCLFQIIDILSDVFYYYQMYNIPLESTLWVKNFQHVFQPGERQAFVSAFEKYEKEQKFSKEFVSYVNNVIKQNQYTSSK